ncbi:3-dehydroquinate synthase [Buchnera aphidicola str. Bp (Baizongia pistaciae)]|uniref:3-dehydroquinate synthase n=1 Tax=Buchnera aphidicola subsp. Baizongia pistaciae (strain Bp) TaxID=224915 RepID=AROB_BUCBP|nr:RecName: Full=3-dehydroquinate synthase; Short=DHQS [Buchnera aphidicola str. Bp (Baizongia pistaciae)]AAO27186.1 3-dehydroquinate synthase [Buchnera aphidicola str. Bp (Baizongia pistaciae)]
MVNLGKDTYPVYIGSNLLEISNIFFPIESNTQVAIITNDVVFKIWNKKITYYLHKLGAQVKNVIISDGEIYKNIDTVEIILSTLLKYSYCRDAVLIALGGGVIGDITGFVASIYQRGIKFVQIPTTLLAQVDASIGGKTSVNHVLGKNMIGSFWQPSSVIINFDFLNTLPRRQLISGIAEIVKYAVSFDVNFFNWLEENLERVLKLDYSALSYCINRCCEIKISIVEKDEKEIHDRMLLNLGHTYGHAIETFLGYGTWLHGEAVSVGIVMASKTSELLGFMKDNDITRIISLLQRVGLPISGPKNMSFESYISNFKRDKKVISGKLRMVLPVFIGNVKIFSNVHENILMSVIKNC